MSLLSAISVVSSLRRQRSVIVASSAVLFAGRKEGATAAALAAAIRARGMRVDAMELPTSPVAADWAGQRRAIELLDLGAICDLLVCVDHPAHLLPHADKRVWLLDPESAASLDARHLEALARANRLHAGPAAAAALRRKHALPARLLDSAWGPATAAAALVS